MVAGSMRGYLADPSSDDDYKESELAQNPQRTEGGSHTRGKILHKQTSRQEVNTHTTLKKSSRIAVQQTKNAQRGRQSGACEVAGSMRGYLADPSSDDDYKESELAQNPQRTEGGSHTRGKILHKQTSRQEVNTHTTLKKSSRIAVQQTKNAQRGRQSGACEGSASTDPQQTSEGTSAQIRINLRHPQQQPSSPGGTPGLISGYLADPSSDDDYKESELAQNPQRTEGGSHTRGKILHKQTSRQEVNTHTTLKKSSRIAVQQTKNAQRGRQSGACEGSASTDPQQTSEGTSAQIRINLRHPQQQPSSPGGTPGLISGKYYIFT
uniref:Uncharacterized protein n=1 Tax=Meloidogyne incognita TaxID=6306 RepID=A0A914MFH4_MELIC